MIYFFLQFQGLNVKIRRTQNETQLRLWQLVVMYSFYFIMLTYIFCMFLHDNRVSQFFLQFHNWRNKVKLIQYCNENNLMLVFSIQFWLMIRRAKLSSSKMRLCTQHWPKNRKFEPCQSNWPGKNWTVIIELFGVVSQNRSNCQQMLLCELHPNIILQQIKRSAFPSMELYTLTQLHFELTGLAGVLNFMQY